MKRLLLVVLASMAGSFACGTPQGSFVDGNFKSDNVTYKVGPPGPGWTEVKLETANAAWHNPEMGAALMVNSHCEGVGDSPLEGLTSDLLMGMTEREIVSQERVPWAKREALHSVATGKLDGVERKLELFVLKKDGCVYDIVLDASPAHFEAARGAFARVREGFNVDARPNRG
jgi:hypothetical protein